MTTQAAIIAQMPTYLGYAADGSRTLDVEGLRAWVTTQVHATIDATALTAGGKAYLKAQVPPGLAPMLQQLAAVIAPAHWAARPDWPLSGTAAMNEISGNRSAAVLAALAAVRWRATQLTTTYDTINTNLGVIIKDKFFDSDIAKLLPKPVARLIDSRFYVTTWVTDWGEESSPSPVSDIKNVDQNDTMTIPRPTVPSGRNITLWRIYRSNVGSASAAFQFVIELPVATTSYTDEKKGSELGEVLPSTTWLEPPFQLLPGTATPSYLRGLVGMANGIMAGFFDNTVCFCEPYVPYGWPVQYQLTVKHPVVGLGSFGQTLFVGTRGAPYLISGSDSASMSAQELPSSQSCSSARSIVSVENGVLYASPDGACLADYNGVKVVTQGLFTREDWQALKPESIVAAAHDGVYYMLYNTGTVAGCYALDFIAGKLGQVEVSGSAFFSDRVTDTLYAVNGTGISALFTNTTRRTGTHRTGVMKMEKPAAMAWLQVDSDFTAPVTVRWYGDGALRHTATVSAITPQRLPAGIYLEHEVEIETTARLTSLTMASSTAELQSL